MSLAKDLSHFIGGYKHRHVFLKAFPYTIGEPRSSSYSTFHTALATFNIYFR
jgi:hypothetical protein